MGLTKMILCGKINRNTLMETSNPKCGHSESGTVEAGGRAADEYPSGVQS